MSNRIPVPPMRRRSGTVLALLTIAMLALAAGQVGRVYAAPASLQSKPTVVLEHGAWADGSSWDAVVERLQARGYTVDVPPNPLRGLTSDAAYLADYLKTVSAPIVLVGHSYGGAVVTTAATGNPNVKALVYVDAFIPDEGETIGKLAFAVPGSCLGGDPTHVFNAVPYPGAPAKDADLYVKPSLYPTCFANGLPASEAALLASIQRPWPLSALSEPSGAPAWKAIPSWSVIGTADHVIPPAEQRFMSQRAGAHITEVRAGHLSMIAQPQAVTAVILQAAQATM